MTRKYWGTQWRSQERVNKLRVWSYQVVRGLKMRADLMKNGILYRCLETKHYLCTIIQNKMGINKLKVVLTEEAQAFWMRSHSKLSRRYTTTSSRLRKEWWKLTSSRNWRIPRSGSFELSTMVYATGVSPFGILRKRLWLLPHMV